MDMKNLVKKVLDVEFDFAVTEVETDGLLVKFDGTAAQVGGSTKPALARAYMLLAKAVSEGKKRSRSVRPPILIPAA